MKKPFTIAIDGTAASGKSSIGALLAKRLGCFYFDTGAIFRAVTWIALKHGLDVADERAITRLAETIKIDIVPPTMDDGREYTIYADSEEITRQIHKPEVDANVAYVSAYPGVRKAFEIYQQHIGQKESMVVVGRGLGTELMPNSNLKVFLDAKLKQRAHRRYREILARGERTEYGKVLDAMRRRDKLDKERKVAPLCPAKDAVIIDTTIISVEEVLSTVLELLRSQGIEYL